MVRLCIHHSKRPLLNNYFNYIEKKNRLKNVAVYSYQNLPMKILTIQSTKTLTERIFSRITTCLFAPYLLELTEMGIPQWKLDGVLAPGQDFVEVAKLFVNARNEIEAGTWTPEKSASLELQVRAHPSKSTWS